MSSRKRIYVVTLNEKERLAAQAAFTEMPLVEGQPQLRSVGNHGYRVTPWTGDGAEIRHMHLGASGNLITALACNLELVAQQQNPPHAWLLFGCAGRVPGRLADDVTKVIVKWAAFGENGVVRICPLPDQDAEEPYGPDDHAHENVAIKFDRITRDSIEALGALSAALSAKHGMPLVKAFSSEKVIQTAPGTAHGCDIDLMGTYGEYIQQTGSQIVDMESYGFILGLSDAIHSTAIIRVLTDSLGDHGDTTQNAIGLDRQAGLLMNNRQVLIDVINSISSDSAFSAPSTIDQSSISQRIVGRAALAPISAKEARIFIRNFADIARIRGISPRWPQQGAPAFDGFLAACRTFSDFGYGSAAAHHLAEDFVLTADDDMLTLAKEAAQAKSDFDPRTALQEALVKMSQILDPTSSRTAYQNAAKGLASRLPGASVAVSYSGAKPTAIVARLRFGGGSRVLSPHPNGPDIVLWRGLEDDARVLESIRVADYLE